VKISNLKLVRIKKGIPQKKVADDLEITPAYLCQMENGYEPVSGEWFIKLAKYYGCSVKELI